MIKTIAFDLDDTLLDTSGLLAPQATREAFQLMIDAGLRLTIDQCEEWRRKWIKSVSHRDVFEKLAELFGDESTKSAAQQATRLFYEPHLPDKLPLLEGARENLDYLKQKYNLYLVTAGTESAQRKKAHALEIEQYFKKIFVVNSLTQKRKKEAFVEIIKIDKIEAQELFCIGNSLRSEIKDALELNAIACFFEFGEERGDITEDESIRPQFHIKHHSELIIKCKL